MRKTTQASEDVDATDKTFPFIAKVEKYLGGIGTSFYSNGTVQLVKRCDTQEVICSPKLPLDKLESFCESYIQHYKIYFQTYKSSIENDLYTPPIEPFWDKLDSSIIDPV